jgi:hypothetical protein
MSADEFVAKMDEEVEKKLLYQNAKDVFDT